MSSSEMDISVNVPLRQQPLKHLNKIAKRPPVDIEFQDLSYSVPDPNLKGGFRTLMKAVSGKFCSGELTAIMGPSGAGKSTLLNILAGYETAGVKGIININGKTRNTKLFNKLSTYIMQEDLVQPFLTVRESMMVAARLKLGTEIPQADQYAVVEEVINLLGLEKCYETRSEHLSGGQRRRLMIALELVNNPPVIFLDEPTTGLDDFAIKQCMELLHKITRLGRTVICTIHQPSALLFRNFDQVYVMANGYCVYNGSPTQLVPFLSLAKSECPATSTPADFIIELVQAHSTNVNVLQKLILNGKSNWTDKKQITKHSYNEKNYDDQIYQDTTEAATLHENVVFPCSFWMQFLIIYFRMNRQLLRNKTMIYIQCLHHIISGLLLGSIYIGTGQDASQTIGIFKYCIAVNVFFMYTYTMVPVLLFPLEIRILRREYFNRWYSLKAYYLAVTLANIPLLVFLGILFMTLAYIITDQPMELNRYLWFIVVGIAMGLCSQGLGFIIGASFNILNGSVIAPHVLAAILAFGVYGMGYGKDGVEPFMKIIIHLSYFRFGMIGFTGTLFNDRSYLTCNEEYCHYKDPKILQNDMAMADYTIGYQVLVILAYGIVFRILAFFALKYRMTSGLRNKIVDLVAKTVKKTKK